MDAILDGADAQPINVKLKELDAERTRLSNALKDSPKEEPLLHPNLASIYRARVDALQAIFRDPDHGREAFELLRGLINEVRILPEDGEYQIELRGELAGILALAHEAKNSESSHEARALQIKMVPGDCIHCLYSQRLFPQLSGSSQPHDRYLD